MRLLDSKACRFYCISLSEQSERHQHILSLSRQWGVHIEFVPAISGQALSEQDLQASGYYWDASMTRWPLQANEIACLLSHRKALEAFLQSDAEYGVVFEDDAEFDQRLLNVIPQLVKIPIWDAVKLEHRPGQVAGFAVAHWQDIQMITPSRAGLGATGLLYRRLGALKVLQMSQRFAVAFDTQFNYAWRHQLNLLQLFPGVVWESQRTETSIGSRSPKSMHRQRFDVLRHRIGRWHVAMARRIYAWKTAQKIRRECARLGLQ